jgi:uncharacterized protein (DUF305 family)
MKKEYILTFCLAIGFVVLVALIMILPQTQKVETESVSVSPTDTSAEASFARDMSEHHAQAVTMSFLVRERTQNEDIRNFAFDIINTQSTQRGMLLGWLDLWNLPLTDTSHTMSLTKDGPETVMNMPMTMPGMATKEEMDRLTVATSTAAEALFLELMIRHHQGGVKMAQELIAQSTQENIVRLAQTMIDGQQSEIEFMQEQLKKY